MFGYVSSGRGGTGKTNNEAFCRYTMWGTKLISTESLLFGYIAIDNKRQKNITFGQLEKFPEGLMPLESSGFINHPGDIQ